MTPAVALGIVAGVCAALGVAVFFVLASHGAREDRAARKQGQPWEDER